MNKKELDLLNKTIEAVVMISDRLDVVFKSVEVIQEHIMKDSYNPRDYVDESDFVEDDINF
tara:strand:+ start:545 stop:727 length:183 start_codon:yes stop_codon:yes gene_type:complete